MVRQRKFQKVRPLFNYVHFKRTGEFNAARDKQEEKRLIQKVRLEKNKPSADILPRVSAIEKTKPLLTNQRPIFF